MSSARIEDPAEMLSKGENVYCKVISVEVGYFLKQRFPLAFFFFYPSLWWTTLHFYVKSQFFPVAMFCRMCKQDYDTLWLVRSWNLSFKWVHCLFFQVLQRLEKLWKFFGMESESKNYREHYQLHSFCGWTNLLDIGFCRDMISDKHFLLVRLKLWPQKTVTLNQRVDQSLIHKFTNCNLRIFHCTGGVELTTRHCATVIGIDF